MRLLRADSLARFFRCALPLALFFCAASAVSSDQAREPIVHPIENANFKAVADPKCVYTAVEGGDPSAGPSTVLMKADKGCFVRWHVHTAEQQVMVIKGEVRVDIAMTPTATLGPGGYVLIPSKTKHQITCGRKSECLLFLTMDRAFDSAWMPLGQ
jgi:quercetin dioxygenase-like cupin family protein